MLGLHVFRALHSPLSAYGQALCRVITLGSSLREKQIQTASRLGYTRNRLGAQSGWGSLIDALSES